jgi:ABC-type dipeptide/oligopeptide/nickel transport system ATPase component
MVPLIEVKGLKTYFHTESGVVRSVDGVDFSIEPQKTLGVVGESGCGKSVTALSIMGLIPSPPGRIEAGEIIYRQNGKQVDLAQLNPKGSAMRAIRGNEIAMIFQEPMTSLNPVYTIGFQIMEVLQLHQGLKKRRARQKAIDILQAVGIPSPASGLTVFPTNSPAACGSGP